MGWPFAAGVATGIVAYLHLLRMRVDLEARRAQVLAHLDDFER